MRVLRRRRSLPSGLRRFLFRLPIQLYRFGLGWVFGRRLLLLNHTGRASGERRQAVLEVVEHDPTSGSYVVAAGWGPTAAWYRNILRTPAVTVEVGRTTAPMTAQPLAKEDAAEVFLRYAEKHRAAARYMLPRVLGLKVDGSESDYRAVGEHLPFVRFVPRDPRRPVAG